MKYHLFFAIILSFGCAKTETADVTPYGIPNPWIVVIVGNESDSFKVRISAAGVMSTVKSGTVGNDSPLQMQAVVGRPYTIEWFDTTVQQFITRSHPNLQAGAIIDTIPATVFH